MPWSISDAIHLCAPLPVGPNSLARPGIISHNRDEDDDCSNGMHEPTQNCRDNVPGGDRTAREQLHCSS